jgi:hypothetical protein
MPPLYQYHLSPVFFQDSRDQHKKRHAHLEASRGVASQPQSHCLSRRQQPALRRRRITREKQQARSSRSPDGPARRRDGVRAEPAPASANNGAGAGSGGGVEYAVSRPGAARGGQAVTRAAGGESPFPFPSPSFPFPSPFRVLRVAFVSTIAGGGAGRGEFTGFYVAFLTHRRLIDR